MNKDAIRLILAGPSDHRVVRLALLFYINDDTKNIDKEMAESCTLPMKDRVQVIEIAKAAKALADLAKESFPPHTPPIKERRVREKRDTPLTPQAEKWEAIKAAISEARSLVGQADEPVTDADIKRHIRGKQGRAGLSALLDIEGYNPRICAALYAQSCVEWKGKTSWEAVYEHRASLRVSLKNAAALAKSEGSSIVDRFNELRGQVKV